MDLLSEIENLLTELGLPLKASDISNLLIARGSVNDPKESVIVSRLSSDINRLDIESRFQRTGQGIFALRSWGLPEKPKAGYRENERIAKKKDRWAAKIEKLPFAERQEVLKAILGNAAVPPPFPALPSQIADNNRSVERKLLEQIGSIDPRAFEEVIESLLGALNFNGVTLTPMSNDGGIDVRGTMVVADVVRIQMAVQVKRWKKNVSSSTVREIRGSLGTHEQGLIITTSGFSSSAREEAVRSDSSHPIFLMDGKQLVRLLVDHNLGAKRTKYELFQLNSEDGFQLGLE
jgi:restriction endonuclease Mrr